MRINATCGWICVAAAGLRFVWDGAPLGWAIAGLATVNIIIIWRLTWAS